VTAGVPLTDVSKPLGHVNPHVTATVYAHALPGRDDLAAAAWENFQQNAGERSQSGHAELARVKSTNQSDSV